MNENERRQLEREASWRQAYEQFNNRPLQPIAPIDKSDNVENGVIHTLVMMDDSEINELETTGQVTVSGPTLEGKVIIVTLRRTGKYYSSLEGKEYRP
jgi:hypothetical protein